MTTTTIYVRPARWFTRLWRWTTFRSGNGSVERPYARIKHAMRAIPVVLPAGTRYVVDVTGQEFK